MLSAASAPKASRSLDCCTFLPPSFMPLPLKAGAFDVAADGVEDGVEYEGTGEVGAVSYLGMLAYPDRLAPSPFPKLDPPPPLAARRACSRR